MDCVSLADNFKQYFEIKFAASTALRQESFKIRHSVYCEELGWEPLRENGMETDECDEYSFALLLVHKRTGQYAGTARLVTKPPPVAPPRFQFWLRPAVGNWQSQRRTFAPRWSELPPISTQRPEARWRRR